MVELAARPGASVWTTTTAGAARRTASTTGVRRRPSPTAETERAQPAVPAAIPATARTQDAIEGRRGIGALRGASKRRGAGVRTLYIGGSTARSVSEAP